MSRSAFLIGLVCLGFFYRAQIFLIEFGCPVIALALSVVAAGRFGPWKGSADAVRFTEWTARALLYAAVPNAVMVMLLCVDGILTRSDPLLRDWKAWLGIAALLVPQLFWSARLRVNRWSALAIALVTLAASAEFWYELRSR